MKTNFSGRKGLKDSYLLLQKQKILFYLFVLMIIAHAASPQSKDALVTETSPPDGSADTLSKPITSMTDASTSFKGNNVKINLSSLLLNNYSLYYERSLTRKITFQAGYRFQPKSTIWKNGLAKQVIRTAAQVDEDTEKDINSFTTSNNTYTGEFRFYGGKRAGAKGFYLGLYGRYANFKFDYANFNFETQNGQTINIPLKGKVKALGAGLVIGAQWWFGKAVCMDLYLLGGHYGSLKGNISGVQNLAALTKDEKEQLKSDIEGTFIIGERKLIEASVNNSGITGNVNAPYMGIRAAGLSVGIIF